MRLVFAVLAGSVLSACGGIGPCASTYTGTWNGTGGGGERLVVDALCNYHYQGIDGCTDDGTYSAPFGSQGSALVRITSSTSGQCLGVGEYACTYSASDRFLDVDCGTGTDTFSR